MNNSLRLTEFKRTVENRFNVYNSIFLNLPFRKIHNTGMLIPLLFRACEEGIEAGKNPEAILDDFFATNARLENDDDKLSFMFRIIQYVERQVVLYDSIEDSSFRKMRLLSNDITLHDIVHIAENRGQLNILKSKLEDFSARLVLTAHPTQFYPPSVLEIISRLRQLIDENNLNEIEMLLQQLGLTSLMNREKPTPVDEAKNIIYYLRSVYYRAVGDLYSHIKKIIPGNGLDNPDIIKLGFWAGGDRDGNPFVTADITLEVADELRMTLMKCYYGDLKALSRKLTFPLIDELIAEIRLKVYNTMFNAGELITHEEILAPLREVRTLLVDRYNSIYLDDVESLIDKVRIFRTHFAVLDIRQDHSVHKKTIEYILKKKGIINQGADEVSADRLLSLLLTENLRVDLKDFEDGIEKETVKTIMQLGSVQKRNGEEGCCRYIISNAEDEFAVMFVYALLKWYGPDSERITFDIIPLYETMSGMKTSADTMRKLFSIPEYRKHISERKDRQTIMLGFSDGTKDGGYLKANWSIFKTKEDLTAVCGEHGIKPVFFDGRGGPPARGGGKTQRFYAAQSNRIANHEIQLTIQGQTITSIYGTEEHFSHNFEQLLVAGMTNCLSGKDNVISEDSRALIEELSEISYESYTSLKNHEMFVPYLENRSPLKYYGKAKIGSRPAKRTKAEKLDLKDLRAIPFVGSWSQIKQNVPGYYGIGTALRRLADSGRLEELKKAFQEVPFFRALILNSMMSLIKCNFGLTKYLSEDPEYGGFWKMLYDEYELSTEMTLLISGYSTLMEKEPVTRSSILIRERIVLPLLIIQQYALMKLESGDENREVYEKIIERSMYGNINANRNSA